MRNDRVQTSNISAFLRALEELMARDVGEEGMGLLWGEPGEGKSTTIAYVQNMKGGIHLRARVTWTVTAMLQAICRELGLESGRYRDPMMEEIARHLLLHPRPIFVDEADYLFRQTDMLDALRDVYDTARVPVVLIGMQDIAAKIRSHDKFKRFRRRITQWIEFKGLPLSDVERIADELCEVDVAPDLVDRIHRETGGNIGRVVIALGKIERYGRENQLDRVDLSEFGNEPLF